MKIKDIVKPETLSALEEINNRYASLNKALYSSPAVQLMQQLEAQSLSLNKYLQPYADIAQAFRLSIAPKMEAFAALQSSLAPLSKQLLEFRSPLQEALEQIQKQTAPLQEAMKRFQDIQSRIDYSQINEAFRSITDVINSIPRDRLIKLRLHSQYWLISDDELLLAVGDNDNLEAESLTDFVIGYYKDNNWTRMANMVQTWQISISQERLDIFNSALQHTQTASSEDVHLLTVPALIAQIDGLIRELYSCLPKEIKKRIEKEITDSLPEEIKSKRIDTRPNQVVASVAELVDYWSAEILQEAIYEGLFKSSNNITADGSYSLYRHKIMHGDKDFLRYGNEENFVRLMLYADFIINLINQVKTEPPKVSAA